jgi:predicted nucleic acid-binding protein
MNTVLLDTNIVSYLFKGDTRAALYEPHLLNRELAVAMMTVAELFQWAATRNWGQARMRRLEETIQNYTILPMDIETCRLWAAVRVQRSAGGHPISSQDAWVAATALRFQLSLVTHNPADYQGVSGLTVITERM